MAKLENHTLRMKRLVAVMSMTAAISFTMLSQKPQTGFSDLKHRSPGYSGSQIMVPPVPGNRLNQNNRRDNKSLEEFSLDEDNAWTNTSFVNLGYVMDQTLKIGGTDYGYNAKWGAALQVGNSYMLPKDAFFDMVKVGIDATWFDLSGVQYDDSTNDRYQITAGMGIGASLHIAPLVNMAEILRPLRVEAYARFVPSYSLLLKKEKEKPEDENGDLKSADMKAHGAFLPVVSCGIALDYRAFGIGYEHRFGNANYKDLTDDGNKIKYDMTSSRIYISFRM